MIDEQADFYNVWNLIQRNLFSSSTALGLHDSTGIPSPPAIYTNNAVPYQLFLVHFFSNYSQPVQFFV